MEQCNDEKYTIAPHDMNDAHRERMRRYVADWRQRKAQDPEYLEIRRAQARNKYQNNKEYREAQKERALRRYYNTRNENFGFVVILVG